MRRAKTRADLEGKLNGRKKQKREREKERCK